MEDHKLAPKPKGSIQFQYEPHGNSREGRYYISGADIVSDSRPEAEKIVKSFWQTADPNMATEIDRRVNNTNGNWGEHFMSESSNLSTWISNEVLSNADKHQSRVVIRTRSGYITGVDVSELPEKAVEWLSTNGYYVKPLHARAA